MLLVVGYCLLVVGCWLLVVGCWLLVCKYDFSGEFGSITSLCVSESSKIREKIEDKYLIRLNLASLNLIKSLLFQESNY